MGSPKVQESSLSHMCIRTVAGFRHKLKNQHIRASQNKILFVFAFKIILFHFMGTLEKSKKSNNKYVFSNNSKYFT